MDVLRSSLVQQTQAEGVSQALSPLNPAEPSVQKREAEKPETHMAEDHVREAVVQANELAVVFSRSLRYEYRKEADVYQVSVIDTSKDQVVRKIPSDEVVRFVENIRALFGALLDVKG